VKHSSDISARTRRYLALGVRGGSDDAGGPTIDEQLARLDAIDDLTDDDLVSVHDELSTTFDAHVAGRGDLATAEKLVLGIETLRSAYLERLAAEEEHDAKLAELAARVAPVAEKVEEPEVEAEVEEPAVEAEVEESTAEEAEVVEEAEAIAEEAAVPKKVAASAARTNARRPESMKPRVPAKKTPQFALRASANVPDAQAGMDLSDAVDLFAAFESVLRSSGGYRGPRTNVPVARIGAFRPEEVFGDERTLGRDAIANDAKIQAVTSLSALRASGGICAPQQVNYALPIWGSDARPFTQGALANFGASRGGVRTLPPPTILDVDGAVDIWTHETDETPGYNTKTCITMDCPSETETLIDAYTRCLTIGNFRARFFPEQVAAWVQMVGVAFARYVERAHMTAVGAASTQIEAATMLSTTRDIFAILDRDAAQMRNRHRLAPNYPFRVVFPDWLLDNMRVDLSREQPGSSDERLAVAEATLESWFRQRNFNVTWTMDGESGQDFGAQGDGALLAWPSHVIGLFYPEGTWLHLDAGGLDLGITRDSTLNSTNDFNMFAETFEAVHFHGYESHRLDIDICAAGNTQKADTHDVCSNGS